MALTLHLVRHASYAALGQVLAGRAEGWPLTAEGIAEAGRIAEFMAGRSLAAVLSSPVQRARQTAEPIAARCGLKVVLEPEITEIDFGAWTGLTFAALRADPAWRVWNRQRGLAAVPGGESMMQAQSRATAAVARARVSWPDAEVVMVSHADVIRAVLAGLLGTPLDLMHRIAIDPASRSVVRLHGDAVEVLGVNLPPSG